MPKKSHWLGDISFDKNLPAKQSWWLNPGTREEFQQKVQQQQPRMLQSRAGRTLGSTGNRPNLDIIE